MSPESEAERLDRLVKEAGDLMLTDPRAAVTRFDEARVSALRLGDREYACTLSVLAARASWRSGQAAQALALARRAAQDAPSLPLGPKTLAKLCEYAAKRQLDASKVARARALYRAASIAYDKASQLDADEEQRDLLKQFARSAQRLADDA